MRWRAGFGQIEAQVLKLGMVAEATGVSKPWAIIPLVITSVQDYIAAGQFRGGEQLLEDRLPRDRAQSWYSWSRSTAVDLTELRREAVASSTPIPESRTDLFGEA